MHIGTCTGFRMGMYETRYVRIAVSTEANPGKFNSRMKNKLQYVNVSALARAVAQRYHYLPSIDSIQLDRIRISDVHKVYVRMYAHTTNCCRYF